LLPELAPGDIVTMDNLPAQNGSGVRTAIEAAGAQLLYLLPSAPGLNPIEIRWRALRLSPYGEINQHRQIRP
jgi:transposase